MADLPADVGTGIVRVQVQGLALASGEAQSSYVPGKVTFTPRPSNLTHAGTGVIYRTAPVSVYLIKDVQVPVTLMATNDPQISPVNWTYQVSFQLESGVQIEPFDIEVEEGSDENISDLIPAQSSTGTYISAGTLYVASTVSGTAGRLVENDTALDLTLTGNATYSLTGTRLGVVCAMRVDPAGHTLTLPGAITVTGMEPVTVTAWRMAEGWIYSVAGVSASEPDPGDTVPPTAGTLVSSAINDTGFTLTVTGATDESALHALPYSFTTDGGTTWSAWQASPVYVKTGLSMATLYNCRHQVRDNASPPHQVTGTPINVTTTGDVVAPTAGTLASSAIGASGFTLTVSGASDETALNATPYAFSTDGGTTWSAWQSSAVFVATGKSPTTLYGCRHQVRDAASTPNTALGSAINVTTSALPGVLTFRGESRSPTSDVESYTYTNVDLGAADANRWVVVAVHWWAAGQRDCSLTIGGVSATSVYAPGAIGANGSFRYFALNVPTGTTADITATTITAGFMINPSIAVWTANQQVSVVNGTYVSVAAGQTTATVTPTTVNGGFVLAGFRSRSNAVSTTWAGITERWDYTGSQPTSGGDSVTTAVSTSVTPTFSVALTQSTYVGAVGFRWGA